MTLSREARVVSGVILLTVPAVMYGGATLLGILTEGEAGLAAGGITLNETQWSFWRAGHAHAGVWLVISLVLQILLDSATLSSAVRWTARIAAPLAAVFVSGGFFGIAFSPGFRWLLYLGAITLILPLIITAVGLLRGPRPPAANGASPA